MLISDSKSNYSSFFESKKKIEEYRVASYQHQFQFVMGETATYKFLGDVIKNGLMVVYLAQKKDFKDPYERIISKSEKSNQLSEIWYKLEQIYRSVQSLSFINSPNLFAASLKEEEKVSLNEMAQYIINLSDTALFYSCVYAKNKHTCLFLLAHKFDENSTVNQSRFPSDLAKFILSISFQEKLETLDRNRIIPKSSKHRITS